MLGGNGQIKFSLGLRNEAEGHPSVTLLAWLYTRNVICSFKQMGQHRSAKALSLHSMKPMVTQLLWVYLEYLPFQETRPRWVHARFNGSAHCLKHDHTRSKPTPQ